MCVVGVMLNKDFGESQGSHSCVGESETQGKGETLMENQRCWGSGLGSCPASAEPR